VAGRTPQEFLPAARFKACATEIAMRRKRLARLLRKLRAMRRGFAFPGSVADAHRRRRDGAGRAFGLVKIQTPGAEEPVTRGTFRFRAQNGAKAITCLVPMLSRPRSSRPLGALHVTQADRICVSLLKKRLGIHPICHQLKRRRPEKDAQFLPIYRVCCWVSPCLS